MDGSPHVVDESVTCVSLNCGRDFDIENVLKYVKTSINLIDSFKIGLIILLVNMFEFRFAPLDTRYDCDALKRFN